MLQKLSPPINNSNIFNHHFRIPAQHVALLTRPYGSDHSSPARSMSPEDDDGDDQDGDDEDERDDPYSNELLRPNRPTRETDNSNKTAVQEDVKSDNDNTQEEAPEGKKLSLEEENRQLKEARLCKVCMDCEVSDFYFLIVFF